MIVETHLDHKLRVTRLDVLLRTEEHSMKLVYRSYLFPGGSPKPKRRGWIKRINANAIECCLRIGYKLHTFTLIKTAMSYLICGTCGRQLLNNYSHMLCVACAIRRQISETACDHEWEPTGVTGDNGVLYDCKKCGGKKGWNPGAAVETWETPANRK